MAFKKVAVIGAGGAVGSEVTKALLAAGFIVTAISRKESTSTFPSGIHVQRVNFDSTEELTSALKGQDVVVSASTTAVVTTASQAGLVDAAIAAGVKRFFPSEFGYVSSRMAQDAALAQVLLGKTKTIEYLEEKVKTNLEFSWTGIGTGMFFDWGLDHGSLGIDFGGKTAKLFDSGNEVISTTTLAYVGQSVAAAVQHESETKNKMLEVIEFNTTQNEILKIIEEESGVNIDRVRLSTEGLEDVGREKLAKGDFSGFVDVLHFWSFRDGHGHAVPEDEQANKLLGLPKTDLRAAIKAYLQDKV